MMSDIEQNDFLSQNSIVFDYKGLKTIMIWDRIYLDYCTFRFIDDPEDQPWRHTVYNPILFLENKTPSHLLA